MMFLHVYRIAEIMIATSSLQLWYDLLSPLLHHLHVSLTWVMM